MNTYQGFLLLHPKDVGDKFLDRSMETNTLDSILQGEPVILVDIPTVEQYFLNKRDHKLKLDLRHDYIQSQKRNALGCMVEYNLHD